MNRTIPALILSVIWTFLSFDLYHLARISSNPNEPLKQRYIQEAINEDVESNRSHKKAQQESSGWGMLKGDGDNDKEEDRSESTAAGWGLSSLGWSGWGTGEQVAPANKTYNQDSTVAPSLLQSIWTRN